MGNGKVWTEEEIQILKDNYLEKGLKFCLSKLNRTEFSIKNKIIFLNIRKVDLWTEEKIELLKEYYPKGIKYCVNLLEMSEKEVRRKANKIGVKVKYKSSKISYETCLNITLKYENLNEFRIKEHSLYNIIIKNRWNELLDNLERNNYPKGYWTFEKCEKEMKIYENKNVKDILYNNVNLYNLIKKNKWEVLYDIYNIKRGKNYWTYEECKEEALKYTTIKEFREKSLSHYRIIHKHKWVELVEHLTMNNLPKDYWTFEKCKEEALKFNTKSQMRDNCKSAAYITIKKNGWDELFSHMEVIGNLYFRMIYAYLFPDNHVYIGLTCNKSNRISSHKLRGTVFNYSQKTNLIPTYKSLTDYIPSNEAQIKEGEFVEYYKNNGYCILNKAKTGGLGGGIVKWSYETTKIEAKNYETVKDFRKKSYGAYDAARRKGWLIDFFPDYKSFSKTHVVGSNPKPNKSQ